MRIPVFDLNEGERVTFEYLPARHGLEVTFEYCGSRVVRRVSDIEINTAVAPELMLEDMIEFMRSEVRGAVDDAIDEVTG